LDGDRRSIRRLRTGARLRNWPGYLTARRAVESGFGIGVIQTPCHTRFARESGAGLVKHPG
jgi:hypothetical protein